MYSRNSLFPHFGYLNLP
uniref:Uncharacterized protein n=1 Tax=Arundo donax TaxID=35708 RepID=A0A0A9FXT1_ARUDO